MGQFGDWKGCQGEVLARKIVRLPLRAATGSGRGAGHLRAVPVGSSEGFG